MSEIDRIITAFQKFKNHGWLPGNSGGLACLCNITDNSKKIYITPDNLKSKLTPGDLFLLRDLYGAQDIMAPLNLADDELKLSRWSSLFIEIFSQKPFSRCVAQLSTKWSILAAKLAFVAWKKTGESYPNLLRLSHWGLLNDLGCDRELLIPVINFGSIGSMLSGIKEGLKLYPKTCAVLVRDYGMLVWGNSLVDLENRIEILERVCQLQVMEFNLLNK